jgi:hypothetical protein
MSKNLKNLSLRAPAELDYWETSGLLSPLPTVLRDIYLEVCYE